MQKWKFVTMFFPLDTLYKKRSVSSYNSTKFYKDQFENLHSLGIELVVYTDKETEREFRPKCGANVTFVVASLYDLHAMSHVHDVERIFKKTQTVPRCIPEWALINCSKAQVMNEIAKIYSDHVICWIDFGMYRPEHDYVDYSANELAEALKTLHTSNVYQTGTIHMGLIDWVSSVEELYDRGGACTVSGQLLFGDYNAITDFSDIFNKQLNQSIQKGTFHADEQIYYEILRQNPDLFTLFPTDYFVSPFNVIVPTKRLSVSKDLLFPNLLKDSICGKRVMCRFNAEQISTVLFS